MNLSFKEWFILESKRKLAVHPGMKQWAKSVETLAQELETLKSILKTKNINVKDDKNKDITKKVNVLDKKLDTKLAKKPDKPVSEKKPDIKKPEAKPDEKRPEQKDEKRPPEPVKEKKQDIKRP